MFYQSPGTIFRTAVFGLAEPAAIQMTQAVDTTVTVVPEPTTTTVLTEPPVCLPTTATITESSSTTSYATTTISTSYPVTVTSNHTIWTTDTLTVTTPVTEVLSVEPTTTTITDYSSITSYITSTYSTSYPVTVTSNHTIWTTDTLTVTTPVTLTETTTFVTSVTSTKAPIPVPTTTTTSKSTSQSSSSSVPHTTTSVPYTTTSTATSTTSTATSTTSTPAPKPTETGSFPPFEFTRDDVCQDWKLHDPGLQDPPWAIYLMQRVIYYGENMRLLSKHCIKHMDGFKNHRDEYIAYIQDHPDVLDSTFRVVKDVDCCIKGVKSIYDEGDAPNADRMKWRRTLDIFLWGTFKPREEYEKRLPGFLEKLREIKEKRGKQG